MKEGEGRPTERLVTIKGKCEWDKGLGRSPNFFLRRTGFDGSFMSVLSFFHVAPNDTTLIFEYI